MSKQPDICRVRTEGHSVIVSVHACFRWADRVRRDPDRPLRTVCRDIEQMSAIARLVIDAPEWTRFEDWVPEEVVAAKRLPDSWLVFSDEIAMPVNEGVASTTLVRGMLSDIARQARSDARKALRHGKRMTAKSKEARAPRFPDKFRPGNPSQHRRVA